KYSATDPASRKREEAITRLKNEIPETLSALEALPDRTSQLLQSIDALKRAQTAISRFEALITQLKQQENDLPRQVDGRAVLIGWIATGKVDYVPTSIHPRCPGVVVHGAIYNAIMSNWFWRQLPLGYTLWVTAALGILSTLAVARLSPSLSMLLV